MLLDIDSSDSEYTPLMQGVFISNFSDIPLKYITDIRYSLSPTLPKSNRGMCDSLENLLEVYPELLYEGEDCRNFVVVLTFLSDDDKSNNYNYSNYIGTKFANIQEVVLSEVYRFHILEKLNAN